MPEVSAKLPEGLSPTVPADPVPPEEEPTKTLPTADPMIMPPMPTPEPAEPVRRGHPVPEGFYTVKKLAEKLDCSEGLICRYISEGGKAASGEKVKLACEMDGNRKIISQASLDAFEGAGVKRRKRRKVSEVAAEKAGKVENQTGNEGSE